MVAPTSDRCYDVALLGAPAGATLCLALDNLPTTAGQVTTAQANGVGAAHAAAGVGDPLSGARPAT